jgi:hypothetical protein
LGRQHPVKDGVEPETQWVKDRKTMFVRDLRGERAGLVLPHRRGIERNAHELYTRVRRPSQSPVKRQHIGEAGNWQIVEPRKRTPIGVVTQDERIRLRAVQKSKSYPGISGMKDCTLAFDHVPVFGSSIGRQHLGRTSNKVGNHRIDCDTLAGYHDPRLSGCAKIGGQPALPKRLRNGERGVLLAKRTIGPNGEEPFAGATAPTCKRHNTVEVSDVVYGPTEPLRCVGKLGDIGETRMKTSHEVEASLESRLK